MKNRAGVVTQARETASDLLISMGTPPKSGKGEAFISGFTRACTNEAITTAEAAQRMAERKRQTRSRGVDAARNAGEVAGYEHLATTMQRAEDDSDDSAPTEHKFKGSNLKKCADCGVGINAKVHKPSWPDSHKS